MEIVPNRKKETLLPIIQRVVSPGSIIHSDEWPAYRIINAELYEHGTVRHKLHFVYPITGVHTQHIESYWNKHKYRSKIMKGVGKTDLYLYINEWMWRDNIEGDCLEKVFNLIKIIN
ncbi:hypothetical protein DMUE_2623 [Dictyocoela muelleri]|nr:hypothetical protein DMUE_2623 [Dictyocoela muelleri]